MSESSVYDLTGGRQALVTGGAQGLGAGMASALARAGAAVMIGDIQVDFDPADIRRMNEVNIVGVALGLKHAFRAMLPGGPARKGGAVVSTTSVAATIPFPGIAGYSATKSAVDRLTRVAAIESGKLG